MIRKAEAKDIEVIAEYNCMMAKETEGIDLDKETVLAGVKNAINDPNKASYYLYETDEKVVGQLMLTKEWSDWRNGYFWWIQSVYVNENYRRRGIYRSLYTYLEEKVKKDPELCGIRLYVEKDNKRAKNTYENLGMQETYYLLYEMEK
ncbi:GNAT family N-acetyltransferase [Natronospora cellulosivora (SeqCode)]